MFFTSRLKLCGSSGFKVVYRSCKRDTLFDLASHALRKRLDTMRSDSRCSSPRVQPRSAIIFFEPQPAGVCATEGGIPVVPLPSSAFLLLLGDLEVDGMNVKPSLQRFLGRPQLVLPKSCANGSDAQTSAEESLL